MSIFVTHCDLFNQFMANVLSLMLHCALKPIFFILSNPSIQNGDFLMDLLPMDCQNGVERDAAHPTASCTVVFDGIGDSKLSLASMDIHQTIDSQMVNKYLNISTKDNNIGGNNGVCQFIFLMD